MGFVLTMFGPNFSDDRGYNDNIQTKLNLRFTKIEDFILGTVRFGNNDIRQNFRGFGLYNNINLVRLDGRDCNNNINLIRLDMFLIQFFMIINRKLIRNISRCIHCTNYSSIHISNLD